MTNMATRTFLRSVLRSSKWFPRLSIPPQTLEISCIRNQSAVCPIRTLQRFCRSQTKSWTMRFDLKHCEVTIFQIGLSSYRKTICRHFSEDSIEFRNAEKLASSLKSELVKVHVESLGIKVEHFNDVIALLQDFGAGVEEASEFLLRHPEILSRTVEQIDNAVKFLVDYGFHIECVFAILPVAKNIFLQKRTRIVEVLDCLRGYGLQDQDILKIASTVPEIFNVTNLKHLDQAYQRLGTLFQTKDMNKIITLTPEILFEDWDDIKRKFDYVVNIMMCDYKQILQSSVMGKSFEHIRARHMFLFRAGLYETPNKRGNRQTVVNPSLSEIVDSTDEMFTIRLCSMDVKDYLVFRDVLSLEDELEGPSDQEDEHTL